MKMENQEQIFITDMTIKKIRHLEDIHILLSKTERKNIIITGKNGSGKTSFLEVLKNNINARVHLGFEFGAEWIGSVVTDKKYSNSSRKNLFNPLGSMYNNLVDDEWNADVNHELFRELNLIFNVNSTPNGYFSQSSNGIGYFIKKSKFLFSSFDAYRKVKFKDPKGPIGIDEESSTDESDFIQKLVNLRNERLEASDSGEEEKAKEINDWFNKFEKDLKILFEDKQLKLKYLKSPKFNFEILQTGKLPFTFNQLSSGYAAVLKIVAELMVQMTREKLTTDIQGVVLIDEIEAHLHIELQKKILPFLTSLFPNIQFIVTTHSPFVLMSDSNSIVFDLETKQLVEDMTKFSLDAIIETYFDSDKYSDSIKKKVVEYEELIKRIEELNESEEERLIDLRRELKDAPKTLAPELSLKLNQLEAAGVL
jgi:predicted ATPase